MIISLSECYYTNKFIPVSTDPTVLKVAKISSLIFLGLIAFFLDCTHKLLVYRNIIQKKDPSNLSSFVENTLNTEVQDTPIVEQIPTETKADKHSENLAVQEKALGVELSSLVENMLANDVPSVIEQVSTGMPTDKYSMSLVVQRKTLETYLLEGFQVTPEEFLRNLKLFIVREPIDFKFVPILGKSPLFIHKYLEQVIERLLKEHTTSELLNDYEEYTCVLREAINAKACKGNKYLNLIIQELCFSKFMGTVLTDLQEKTLKSTIKLDSLQSDISSNISELISEDNKILRKQPKRMSQSVLLNFEKACNASGINSDQLSSANIPELRSIHKVKQGVAEPYDIYYIRYPTPTIEGLEAFLARFKGSNATAIAPEFIGFLDSIKKKKIPFLHVNHQYMDKKKDNDFLLSADNNRAEAIQRLEETHAEVFHFLSLPFDGPIIKEIDAKNLKSWKKNLVDAVIQERKGFRLPKKFRESATSKKKEIKQLLDNLQRLYFSGKLELNEIERRVLLVIFYSYLKEYFKSGYQIRIMASVCKDNKDRGNVSACIDEALFNLRLGRENDQQALKDLHLRILSPFIFREEGIVEHRLKFLTDLLNHIATLSDDQKEKIRAFKVNEQYQIVDQWIPRSNEDVGI